MAHAHLKLIKTFDYAPSICRRCRQKYLRHERECYHNQHEKHPLGSSSCCDKLFTPNLARSKRSGYYTNIIVKITGPDININNTRETFRSIRGGGVSPLKRVGSLIILVRPNTSHTSDSPLRWYKLQFKSPKNRQRLLSVKKSFPHSRQKITEDFFSNSGWFIYVT